MFCAQGIEIYTQDILFVDAFCCYLYIVDLALCFEFVMH